jgi:hypothetical protein
MLAAKQGHIIKTVDCLFQDDNRYTFTIKKVVEAALAT